MYNIKKDPKVLNYYNNDESSLIDMYSKNKNALSLHCLRNPDLNHNKISRFFFTRYIT